MTQPNVIHWFNQDLRLLDNPALFEAAKNNNVLPVYILDNVNKGSNNFIGQASMVWLHHSLESLNENIDDKLSFFKGNFKGKVEGNYKGNLAGGSSRNQSERYP